MVQFGVVIFFFMCLCVITTDNTDDQKKTPLLNKPSWKGLSPMPAPVLTPLLPQERLSPMGLSLWFYSSPKGKVSLVVTEKRERERETLMCEKHRSVAFHTHPTRELTPNLLVYRAAL